MQSTIYRDINAYSKEKQLSLFKTLNNLLWDTSYNPSEFLELLASKNTKDRTYALSKMVEHMSYRDIRALVTKEFIKNNLSMDIIETVWSQKKQTALKKFYKKLLK